MEVISWFSKDCSFKFDLYRYTVDVRKAQEEWEAKGEALVHQMDALYHPGGGGGGGTHGGQSEPPGQTVRAGEGLNREQVTAAYFAHAEAVRAAWWRLADVLMVQYADGFVSMPGQKGGPGRARGKYSQGRHVQLYFVHASQRIGLCDFVINVVLVVLFVQTLIQQRRQYNRDGGVWCIHLCCVFVHWRPCDAGAAVGYPAWRGCTGCIQFTRSLKPPGFIP
jgi:hypothetical protein